MTRKLLAVAGLVLALTGAALGQHAAPVTVGDITVSDGFSRATLPNAPVGGGYFTITNAGTTDDVLLSATSPAAKQVQLHEMRMENDVMRMRQLEDGIAVPAGASVSLAPGGLHLMLMGLNAPLVEGETVPVTLTFEKAGTLQTTLQIGGIAAAAHAHH